jgi:NADP-dependent 3-hydroxy acid dehydrogenase YdfG
VAIVTGASSGIGAATARLLAAGGASVVHASRRADRLEAFVAGLGDAIAVPTDVTVADDRRWLVGRTVAVHGRVDLTVNDAGPGLHATVALIDPDDLRAVFDFNVVAALAMTQAVLPSMQSQSRVPSST